MTNTTNIILRQPLSQNEPESNITHGRKYGRLNDVNEGTRDLGDKSLSHLTNLQHLMAQDPGWIIVCILMHVPCLIIGKSKKRDSIKQFH